MWWQKGRTNEFLPESNFRGIVFMRNDLKKRMTILTLSFGAGATFLVADASAQRNRGKDQPGEQKVEKKDNNQNQHGDRATPRTDNQPAREQRQNQQREQQQRQARDQQQQTEQRRRDDQQRQARDQQQNDQRRRDDQTRQTEQQRLIREKQQNDQKRQADGNRQRGGWDQKVNEQKRLAEQRRIEESRRQINNNNNNGWQNGRQNDDRRNANQRYEQFNRQQQEALQRQRSNQYNQQWYNWQSIERDRQRRLEQQRRNSCLRYQQSYWQRLRQDQLRLQQARFYDNLTNNYRYNRGGQYYYTSQYGSQMLRQAIDNGYEQGLYAGQADRNDGWGFDYQNSYGYQDAAFGYDSYYVSYEDYNYYFRQGFQRGYDDGYYGRNQYGSYSNGRYSLLGRIFGSILDIGIY